MDHLSRYIQALNVQLGTGLASEHSYRSALQTLLQTLLPASTVTNEPHRTAAGAPDYIIAHAHTQAPIAYVEAKGIGDTDLHGHRQHKEQFDRYKQALGTVLFTDYLHFHLYEGDTLQASATIGECVGQRIVPRREGEAEWHALIGQLRTASPNPARSARELAMRMAAKAQLLAQAIRHALSVPSHSSLQSQLKVFKTVLLHDVTRSEFADLYAQTITYGLFAARLQQQGHTPFSRQQAVTQIPKTNPFLRQLFQQIAGYDIDPHLEWIVAAITQLLAASDVPSLMAAHQASHREPIAHFYEDFLAAYDPTVRRQRGVWYTPSPVVDFIVRAVDDLLRTQFGLPLGLADASRTGDHHRVQILDPAAGTGAFLTSVVRHIHEQLSEQVGAWSDYVDRHLLPRLHGFELLMAPYTIAHLRLDLLLRGMGWRPDGQNAPRIGIYLTNALEAQHPDTDTLFTDWLSEEANQANRIKRESRVMVMLGNPPYSVSSRNKGAWISQLLEEYKEGLNERNIQPLSDDYIKFIRLAQHYVSRTGEGIVALITNSSYLEGVIHRQMRLALRRAFDTIYILDLHGNARNNATDKPAQKDENLFDIMTGVSICLLVKHGNGKEKELAPVFHHELRGAAEMKRAFLDQHTPTNVPWHMLEPQAPYHFFVPKDFSLQAEYDAGFRMDELFIHYANGIKTSMDHVNVHFTPEGAETLRQDALRMDDASFRETYRVGGDKRDWSVARAQADVRANDAHLAIAPYAYRPFDVRYIVYTGKTCGIVAWPRSRTLNFLRLSSNFSINLTRKIGPRSDFQHVLMANTLPDLHYCSESNYAFGLYCASPQTPDAHPLALGDPMLNMHPEMLARIAEGLGYAPDPLELMEYIYAVLHSPRYRARYREFLRIEFPRIPYPMDRSEYERLAALGRKLRMLHLLEGAHEWKTGVAFTIPGDNAVESVSWRDNRVWINTGQHFSSVPQAVWDFPIGSYRPAQKWLKDRLGRRLSFDEIQHYAQITYALRRTGEIMREIDAS